MAEEGYGEEGEHEVGQDVYDGVGYRAYSDCLLTPAASWYCAEQVPCLVNWYALKQCC